MSEHGECHDTAGNTAITPRFAPWMALFIGVLAVSTASTFIRLAQQEIASLAVAAWRLTFATLMLLPFVSTSVRAAWSKLRRRDWGLLLVSGFVLAIHFHTWISSLAMTSVAASVVLVSVSPLFVVLLSWAILKEPLRLGDCRWHRRRYGRISYYRT